MFSFPVGFNGNCALTHDNTTHKSAVEYPRDVDACIEEEQEHGAQVGPFSNHPVPDTNFSAFMTRPKPNAVHRRVILDLS